MVLIGYYQFNLEGVDKLGLFSSCEINDHFSVELFLITEQELRPLGENHLLHLPMVFIDRRKTYILSAAQTESIHYSYCIYLKKNHLQFS